jgi:hypothetical protein
MHGATIKIRLRVFESRIIFGPRREEVTGR